MRIRKYKIRNEEHEVADLRILKAQLNQQLFMISQPNEKVMDAAWQRWDSIGKPLRSLGAMERAVVKMAGMGEFGKCQNGQARHRCFMWRSRGCQRRRDPDRQQCDPDRCR